ncbi:MAG: hypothetical protein KDK08_18095, partial [Rhizobiaceae bacterium]|nr:hypothetical protein [Rhizobiaceae bacterium]
MLESGEFATIAELAEREGITPPYVTRILQLTLLAPDIVNDILDGRQSPRITLNTLRDAVPICWAEQGGRYTESLAPTVRDRGVSHS